MRPEFRDKLLSEVDGVVSSLGASNINEAIELACRLFEGLLSLLSPVRTREQLVRALDSMEVASENEQATLAAIRALPHYLGMKIGEVGKQAASDLVDRRSGKPQALSIEQRVQACDLVAKLHREGTPLKHAKQRAAQRFHVSPRTIERIWEGRRDLPRLPQLTIEDGVQLLTAMFSEPERGGKK